MTLFVEIGSLLKCCVCYRKNETALIGMIFFAYFGKAANHLISCSKHAQLSNSTAGKQRKVLSFF